MTVSVWAMEQRDRSEPEPESAAAFSEDLLSRIEEIWASSRLRHDSRNKKGIGSVSCEDETETETCGRVVYVNPRTGQEFRLSEGAINIPKWYRKT